MTVIGEEGEGTKVALTYFRDDFLGNKQLNFPQHVKSLLKISGRAAIVVPDELAAHRLAGGALEKGR
jgi:type I restriction enzyme M protein